MANLEDDDVSCVVKHPCLLDKAKTPGVTERKNKAVFTIQDELSKAGKHSDGKKIIKKLVNIKARLKAKTDMMKTGNKKIVLRPWEEEMLKFMSAEEDPVFSRVPGYKECGAPQQSGQKSPSPTSRDTSGPSGITAACSAPVSPPKKDQPGRRTGETGETASLSNAELQRLVLLEQMQYFRTKNRLLMEKQAWQHQAGLQAGLPALQAWQSRQARPATVHRLYRISGNRLSEA